MTQADEAFLEHLITNHYQAAKEHLITVAIYAALAVITFVSLPRVVPTEAFKDLAGVLGGGIFGGLGFLPGKEVLDRREKARNLRAIQPFLHTLQQNPEALDPELRQRIKATLLELIEKTALG